MNTALFFATVRARLGRLSQLQVTGFEAVLAAAAGAPLAHAAYMLATAWHETAATMQPVLEANWLSESWRRQNLRYYPWHGRGYVQLTWESNYRKADAEAAKAGLIKPGELLANADLAMRPDIAALIMRRGMDEGWFASDKRGPLSLTRYLPTKGTATGAQYIEARRIINGTDKAALIESYAQAFERALRDGGWA